MTLNFNNGITLVAVLVAFTILLHLDFPFRAELIFLSVIYILGVDVTYLLIRRIKKKMIYYSFTQIGGYKLILKFKSKR